MSTRPAAVAPMPAARPSSSVDLPDPFSPTRNVTDALNSSLSSQRNTGRVQGNASGSNAPDFRSMALRNMARPPLGEGLSRSVQPRREAGGVPAAAAHGLNLGVELVDQGGELEARAVGPGFVEHKAQILTHPVDREAEIELALRHRLP